MAMHTKAAAADLHPRPRHRKHHVLDLVVKVPVEFVWFASW